MTVEERRRIQIYDDCLKEAAQELGTHEGSGFARAAALKAMRMWGTEMYRRAYEGATRDQESRSRNRPGDGDMGG